MQVEKENVVPGASFTMKGFVAMYHWGGMFWTEQPNADMLQIVAHDITITVPEDFNVTAAEVAAIDTKLNEAADNYFREVKELKERKESLLCIGHTQTIHDSEGNFDDVPF